MVRINSRANTKFLPLCKEKEKHRYRGLKGRIRSGACKEESNLESR